MLKNFTKNINAEFEFSTCKVTNLQAYSDDVTLERLIESRAVERVWMLTQSQTLNHQPSKRKVT